MVTGANGTTGRPVQRHAQEGFESVFDNATILPRQEEVMTVTDTGARQKIVTLKDVPVMQHKVYSMLADTNFYVPNRPTARVALNGVTPGRLAVHIH